MYLYQSHFFPRNVLKTFWAEVSSWETVCNRRIGEDMHIAYVVPHPKADKNIWGNIVGDTYGEDEHVHAGNRKFPQGNDEDGT